MAIPTQPTAALICGESYRLFGINSPNSAQLTRAADYGMEIVKSDLKDLGLEWDFLRTSGSLSITAGVNYVALPTDCSKIISVRLLVGTRYKELDFENLYDASSYNTMPAVVGEPNKCYVKGNDAEGLLYFDKTPDQAYTAQIEYYIDILKVDLTSTLYSRILRLLNGLFIQGVFVWLLQDDARVKMERQIYEKKKAQTAALYLYPDNLSKFDMRVDY